MSYIIPKASTQQYPKYHIGSPDHVACGAQACSGTLIEVDEPPQGYLPCRTCFKKEKSKTTKWKRVKPLTVSLSRDGVEFKNKSLPINMISEISSKPHQLPGSSKNIIISHVKPAGKIWVFPSREAARETMAYIKDIKQQSWSDASDHKVSQSSGAPGAT